MKHSLLSILCASLCAFPTFAQNINPTVEVTNTYEGNLMEIHKPQQVMALPDSLMHFNLDFNYSVFESPYKGAYEFKPYAMNMKPQPDAYTGKMLYVRAGAGYSLHPELTLVYSPQLKGKYQMSVYDNMRSYFGSYRNIQEDLKHTSGTFDGHDFSNRFGADGRVDWSKSILTYDVGFSTIAAKDTLIKHSYNAVDVAARFRSNNDSEQYFYYDGCLSMSLGKDVFTSHFPSIRNDQNISENIISFNGSFGPVMNYVRRILFDVNMTMAYYGDMLNASVGSMSITPKYQFDKNRWTFSLGGKISYITKSDDTDMPGNIKMFQNDSQVFYPDIHISFDAIRSYLTLYGYVTGGDHINTYRSVLSNYHFFNPMASYGANAMLDNTQEKINFAAGVKGNVATRFQYDLKAGYAFVDKGVFDKVCRNIMSNGGSGREYCPGVIFANYKSFYSQLLFAWNSRNVTVDGDMHYQTTKFEHTENNMFKPSALTGDIRVLYNWNNRIYAGVNCAFASSRRGYIEKVMTVVPATIPAYTDLGLSAEYQFSRKMSFWVNGGNLLNQNIQRHPFEPNSGIYFTAGICLNL